MKNKKLIFAIIGIIFLLLLSFYFIYRYNTFSIIGSPKITYSTDSNVPMKFGSDLFTTSNTIYDFVNCEPRDDYDAPEPDINCWMVNVNFQNKDFIFHYGETIKINDYFQATYSTTSEINEPDEEHLDYWLEQRINKFDFELYNKEFLNIDIPSQTTLVKLNDDKNLIIIVQNLLSNNLQGGLIITTLHYLENQIPEISRKKIVFNKGIDNYEIPLDTSKLGKVNIKVRAYVEIMGIEFHNDAIEEITFNIVPFIDKSIFSGDCKISKCPDGFSCESIKYNNTDYNICIKSNINRIDTIKRIDIRLLLISILLLFLLFLLIVYIIVLRRK